MVNNKGTLMLSGQKIENDIIYSQCLVAMYLNNFLWGGGAFRKKLLNTIFRSTISNYFYITNLFNSNQIGTTYSTTSVIENAERRK